jgi:tRNA(adenine34) deaminase
MRVVFAKDSEISMKEPAKTFDNSTVCPFAKIHPSELNRDDSYFMAHAFNRAVDAWQADEVPIGAVIVHAGAIIASAFNQTRMLGDPTAHAEMLAIGQAARALGDWRLNECTLYVTKEPCPMCSGAMVVARMGRVVFGLPDPKMGCVGGAVDLGALPQSNHHFETQGGVLLDPCQSILQAFFKLKRSSNLAENGSGFQPS